MKTSRLTKRQERQIIQRMKKRGTGRHILAQYFPGTALGDLTDPQIRHVLFGGLRGAKR